MYEIAYTERFKKSFNKLTKIEKKQFQAKMEIFIENIMHPSLRTKKYKAKNHYMRAV